ncbi:MAG TPA: carbon starvation CstA family protein [Acidobacteriota bacterium]|jgi:carbon starvation protein|nr:carbon starvation CstA family protein [Acidobacteriota bacterium]HNT17820.1 carbon starvation CstA family protein [Acidobacteriota bacterium]HPA27741.1 carbon starvation CstA family protein [Acidobacteriota bacterium]HQO20706.1 carbon starvation CstA family protein [Acidobacteriota bacterium]HQQ48015.1 carbon starvation CstA family protein [Acidobacteriota bacterium]
MLPLSIFLFALLYLGYRFYASYLGKLYSVKSGETVPSVEMRDNIDYVPTNKFVLLGHHFSSIAGAGPVVGPIIAAMAFGWLPAVIWIIIGSIFIGGLHDYSSLIISVRHKGKSIAEVANQYINKRTYRIFLIFIWLALIYVVAVFADLTAVTFSNEPAVAEVSTIYLIVAVVFGFLMVKFRGKLATLTTGALLTLLLFSVLSFKYQFLSLDKSSWVLILFIYCFAASILPVNLLLQPRDYLSSYLLYFSVLIGLVGLMFGRYPITYPAFISFSSESLGGLFPFLFITIACGAVSGFHALVASGTTSKQIDDINNGKFVGYGAMLLEGVVAIISIGIVMMLAPGDPALKGDPGSIFASGLGRFSALVGIDPQMGKTFGFLAISAFMLTTLDTATRIARYVLQEILDKVRGGWTVKISATAASLAVPLVLMNLRMHDAAGNVIPCWKMIWPLFGITNQLLAALVLMIIYLWAGRNGVRNKAIILVPALFMLVTTVTALVQSLTNYISAGNFTVVFYIALLLLALSLVVVVEALLAITRGPHPEGEKKLS